MPTSGQRTVRSLACQRSLGLAGLLFRITQIIISTTTASTRTDLETPFQQPKQQTLSWGVTARSCSREAGEALTWVREPRREDSKEVCPTSGEVLLQPKRHGSQQRPSF